MRLISWTLRSGSEQALYEDFNSLLPSTYCTWRVWSIFQQRTATDSHVTA
jgi:hypothetical protein